MLAFLNRYKYYLIAGLGTWVLLVVHKLSIAQHMHANPDLILLHEGLADIILFSFFFANILLVRQVVKDGKDRSPQHLLRILLVTGIVGGVVVSYLRWYLAEYENTTQELLTMPVIEAIMLLVLVVFLFTGIYTFRRFVFYTGTRVNTVLWTLFEIVLGVGLLIIFENPFYFIAEWIKVALLACSLILIFYFSVFTRWVAYLTLKQKLTSIFLLALTILILLLLLYEEGVFSQDFGSLIHEYFFYRYFILGVAALFIASYSLFSILVLIFNLPTGFVFEKTRKDLVSIQKIQQSIIPGLAREGAARTLLEASILSSNANAGWIELENYKGEEDSITPFLCSGIELDDAVLLKQNLNLRKLVLDNRKIIQWNDLKRDYPQNPLNRRFRSMMVVPIQTRYANIGAMFLVQDQSFAFTDENQGVIKSFSDQAAIAMENITLTEKSLELERYREQLAIARQMQMKLYPSRFPDTEYLSVFARNQQAESVGGDYYDILHTEPGVFKIIIGDVAGKGTTAAFYMAQVKGMFQSLARTTASPQRFLNLMNQAISSCMDTGTFVTMTYIHLDLNQSKAWIARGGHCPTLFYHASDKKLVWMMEGGLALGMVRNASFADHIFVQELTVQAGDRLFLLTDGLVEARNDAGEEYDYDRFLSAAEKGLLLTPEAHANAIIEEVEQFTGAFIEDDYTLMILEIKRNSYNFPSV